MDIWEPGKVTLDDIHELLSARNFQTRFCAAVPELPSFVGVPCDILHDSGVPVPRDLLRDPSVCSEDDAWLIHFPTTAARASYTSAVGEATAVHLMAAGQQQLAGPSAPRALDPRPGRIALHRTWVFAHGSAAASNSG